MGASSKLLVMRSFLVTLALALAAVSTGFGFRGGTEPIAAAAPSTANQALGKLDAPAELTPVRAAPRLRLRDSLGKTIDLRAYRGKAVFVTFVYVHCPDTCPLIVGNLHAALARLGSRASQVQLIAVSTDPAQDTPNAVKTFLRAHLMTGRMEYLLGDSRVLANVWKQWGIHAHRVDAKPEDVEHSALIYGITGSGKLKALYPANFKPEWIVHDAAILARQ